MRPRGKPSRINAWFMAASPSDIAELGAVQRAYYYELEPLGPVHEGDSHWIVAYIGLELPRLLEQGAIDRAEHDARVRAAGAAYWASEPYVNLELLKLMRITRKQFLARHLFEFHTAKVRVVRQVSLG